MVLKEFGLKGEHQLINSAMALQMVRIWCHEKRDLGMPLKYS